jgi:cytochrome P450
MEAHIGTKTSDQSVHNIPAHIPQELIRDFDFFKVEAVDGDLHLGWRALHDGPDIFYTPHNGGHWVFTRAADIEEAYRDTDRFSSKIVALPYVEHDFRFAPAEYDPPEVHDYRRILAPGFSPASLRKSEEIIRSLCIRLIEGLKPLGRCEFQSSFSQHLPIAVFLGMMDFPMSDADRLLPLAEAHVRNPDPAVVAESGAAMHAYLTEKIGQRMQAPADDLTSQVIAGSVGGRAVRVDEVVGMCMDLMFAGLDTVVAALGFSMNFLARHPDHQAILSANPALIPEAIEEMLRYHGLTNMARMVRDDIAYRGVTMRAGETVLLSTTLHGLDERRFPDATTINFDREDKTHMIFGSGVHRCLGSHLARLELKIFWQEWFARIPRFHIDDQAGVEAASGRTNMMMRLPIAW